MNNSFIKFPSYTHTRINGNMKKILESTSFIYGLVGLLSEKGLITIEELDEKTKNRFKEMALEAHENLEKIKPEELKEGEGKSPVSTQFFSTELNAAYEQLKKEKGDELKNLREHMGDVARDAAHVAYEALSVALQKSKNSSDKDIDEYLAKLRIKAVETWNKFKVIALLRLFG